MLPTAEKLLKGLTLESSNKVRAGVSSLMLTSNEKQLFINRVQSTSASVKEEQFVTIHKPGKWVKIKMSISRQKERDCL